MAPRELNLKRLRDGIEQLREFRRTGVNAYAPEFKHWQERVEQALKELLPDAPLARQLSHLHFCLPRVHVMTSRSRSAEPQWTTYDQEVYAKDAVRAEQILADALEELTVTPVLTTAATDTPFVDQGRIEALRAKAAGAYDLSRLIKLCEELNKCYEEGCYLAVAALTRALLDHVPPLFNSSSFAEVANNHPGGKSFKESMAHLEKSSRNISDGHLHQRIRHREDLPTQTQVNFSRDLDVLLGEIIRTI